MSKGSVLGLAAVSWLSACVIAEPGEPNVEVETQEAAGCPPLLCLSNSPEIDHAKFHDFSTRPSDKNAAGFSLLGMIKDKVGYTVVVKDSQLYGMGAGTYITGPDLVGAMLVLKRGSSQYAIVIEDEGQIDEVASSPATLQKYMLDWSPIVGNPLSAPIFAGQKMSEVPTLGPNSFRVCPDQKPGSSTGEWDESTKLGEGNSILFEGDRINAYDITVNPNVDDAWFNIGCAYHTLSKMRLTRSTMHTNGMDQARSQATLKMLTANYCETSHSTFTYSGEPLVWTNWGDYEYKSSAITSLEARWDEHGAICLGDARLNRTTFPQAATQYPDLLKQIAAECPNLMPCGNSNPFVPDSKAELVTSGNYD
jgi:hypothetical protein